ncbi:MAG: hypothetical protein ACTSVI_12950 [Promethearchaeota archaeon]
MIQVAFRGRHQRSKPGWENFGPWMMMNGSFENDSKTTPFSNMVLTAWYQVTPGTRELT